MDDFYDLLEVSEDASQTDIREAWREKARQYHPDVNDDDRASAQFKTLRAAYDVLSDESKRSAYDRLGHADYVSKRLDGLPTAGMTRPNASSGSNRWQGRSSETSDAASARASGASSASGTSGVSQTRSSSRSRSTTGDRSQSSARSTDSRTSSNRSAAKTSGASASNASASNRSTSNASSANRASGTASRSASADRASTASSRAASARADTAERTGAGTAAEATDAGATEADAATRNPLWYGWVATLLAGAVYLGGLAVYLGANADALSSVAAALATSPRTALLANHGLTLPGTFALEAVAAAPGPALAFPAGAALLAVVFAAVVAKFGHGTAYLYLLGALAPLAALAVGPAVSVPAVAATLALVVVLPVLGTALFLADAGRFLLAD